MIHEVGRLVECYSKLDSCNGVRDSEGIHLYFGLYVHEDTNGIEILFLCQRPVFHGYEHECGFVVLLFLCFLDVVNATEEIVDVDLIEVNACKHEHATGNDP